MKKLLITVLAILAIFLVSASTLPSAIILFLSFSKSDFNAVINERIVPLSVGLIVTALLLLIFSYVLTIKSKRVKN